jgi:hypothetical protein
VKKRDPCKDLDVRRVLEEFQKAEELPPHRNGTFKIDAPFEDALKTILKAKTGPATPKSKRLRSQRP